MSVGIPQSENSLSISVALPWQRGAEISFPERKWLLQAPGFSTNPVQCGGIGSQLGLEALVCLACLGGEGRSDWTRPSGVGLLPPIPTPTPHDLLGAPVGRTVRQQPHCCLCTAALSQMHS